MLLPWFNKYVSTDFHELNIDWLCTAYKDFIEQLQAFDTRLTGIETDVDTRLTAMEGRIDDQDQAIADFKEEVNTRFQELADSIAQQFTDLETEFNGKFDDLEQSINDQFTQLSGDIDERITQFENDITGRLDDFEEAIDARMDTAEDNIIALQDTDKQIKAALSSQQLLNLYPETEQAYFPDYADDITVNMIGGKITASGEITEDANETIAGGPNEIPYGWITTYNTLYRVCNQIVGNNNSNTLKLTIILYENGVETRRVTINNMIGSIMITEAEQGRLSGIEIVATAEANVNYDVAYIPYIIAYPTSSGIANNSPVTYPELVGNVRSFSGRLNADIAEENTMQGRNVWMVDITGSSYDTVDGVTIGISYDGITIDGTASADVDYDTSIKLTPEIGKAYRICFKTDAGSTAVKFKLHNSDDSIIKIYDPDNFYVDTFAAADELTLAVMIPAGTYSYSTDKYYPFCSDISSNYELMDEVGTLTDRVDDIDNQLMGETTYGPDDEVTFTDPVGDVPLKEVIAYIEPVQDLHGYDYPWPEGCNKNMINAADGTYTAGSNIWSGSLTLQPGFYTLSAGSTSPNTQFVVVGVGSGDNPYTFEIENATTITAISTVTTADYAGIQLEAGTEATSFVPYSNICPISGHSNAVIDHNNVQLTIALGGTYYRGELNVTSGVLTVTSLLTTYDKNSSWVRNASGVFYVNAPSGISDLYMCNMFDVVVPKGSSNNITNGQCRLNIVGTNINFKATSCDTVEEFKALIGDNTIQVVYELVTPMVFQLTPYEIETILGSNTISNTAGRIQVTTQSFIQSMIEKFTERFIITYDSVAGTVDKTYNEIFEAYIEGRRLCFSDGDLITELNQFDETNGIFHWEYNEFTATGIDFYEMLIDINGVTVSSKSVTI